MVDTYSLGIQNSEIQNALKAGSTAISRLVDINTFRKMEFIDAVNMRTTENIDVHMFCQDDELAPLFEIGEGTTGAYSRPTQYEKVIHLTKYRCGVEITDESKIRLDRAVQLTNSIKSASKTFAWNRDLEILRTFLTSYGVSATAGAKWNTSAADPAGDLGNLIDAAFTKDIAKISEDDINNMVVYYPAKLYSQIRQPAKLFEASQANVLVTRSQVNTTDFQWAGDNFGITWVGSQKLNYVGKTVCVIKSDETADHYTYSGSEVPEVEQGRDAREGTDYLINTRYFGTMVYPNSKNQKNNNDRIMVLNTVCDPLTMGNQ